MKQLSALIAVLFASASLSVFAQATPATSAPPGQAGPGRRGPRPPPPLPPSPPPPRGPRSSSRRRTRVKTADAEEESPSEEESRPEEERAKPRRPQPKPRRADAAKADQPPKADAKKEAPEEVIGPSQRQGRRGPRPRPFAFSNAPRIESNENRRRHVRRSGFLGRRMAAQGAGFEVVGLFMKNWEDDDNDEYCTSREDLIDAVAVAERIGIEIEAVNFAAEYRERVFTNFLSEYRAGARPIRTCCATPRSSSRRSSIMPWPWARIGSPPATTPESSERDGALRAAEGPDPGKDQSYFLYRLNQAQLARTLFPVGHLLKRDVRRIAREAELPTMPSATPPASASLASGRSGNSCCATCRASPGPMARPRASASASTRGSCTTPSASARAWASAGGATAPESPGTSPARIWREHAHRRARSRPSAAASTRLDAADASWVAGAPPAMARRASAPRRATARPTRRAR